MAATIPMIFPSVTAIETMMAGLGNARCKSLGIGRHDNYNAKIHRPRDAHHDANTREIVGRVYQHRAYSVNKPNGRIIWIFERSSDQMLFLLKPRKGPLAYKVWQADETFSAGLWLYGQNWLPGEKAAELRGPADLQEWLQENRPLDAGTSGDYVEYKAHIEQLATPHVAQSLAVPLDDNTGLPIAPTPPNTQATNSTDAQVTEPTNTQVTEPINTYTTELVPGPSTAEEVAPAVSQLEQQSGEASTTTSTTTAKKSTKSRTRTPAVVAPSTRVLRQRGKKRNADEAELDNDEAVQQQALPVADAPLPGSPAPKAPVVAAAIEMLHPVVPRPAADPSSLLKIQSAPKKRKFSAADLEIAEAECEQHSKRLLTSWSSDSSDIVGSRDLVGIDITPYTQNPALGPEFISSQHRTIIRYSTAVCDAFGGFENLGGRAVAQTVPFGKRRRTLQVDDTFDMTFI